MSCAACGGDGQIEYGAYCGDESGETRECRLCGGAITKVGPLAAVGVSAEQAVEALNRLAGTGMTIGPGVATHLAPAVPQCKPFGHSWRERVFPDTVEYECETCRNLAIFSRSDGSVVGLKESIAEIDRLDLKYQAAKYPAPQTPQQIAAERLEQLRQENERLQRKAETVRGTNDTMNRLLRGDML